MPQATISKKQNLLNWITTLIAVLSGLGGLLNSITGTIQQ